MFSRASQYVEGGEFVKAELLYRDILSHYPDHPRALHALGVVMYRGGGDAEDALRLVRRAVDRKPDYLDARCNLGNMLNELRRFAEAEECYRAVLAMVPGLSRAWQGLGNIRFGQQRFEEALHCYGKAADCSADAMVFVQSGTALRMLGRLEEAAAAFRSAVALRSDCGEAYYGLATVYEAGANLVAAQEYAVQALKLLPSSSAAMQIMGGILLSSGRGDEALVWYRRAVEAGGGALALSNLLYAMNYCQSCKADEMGAQSRRWEEAAAIRNEPFDIPLRSPGRLRIGYVSPDFRTHSVAFFFEPLLRAHNRDRFEIHCYSNVLAPDAVTERLKEQAEQWHDIRRLSDEEAVEKIRADRIDILVDLAGHTADNRLGIFARRAAPVQMTWLGYPATTGISAMDYRITDAVADPEGVSDSYHSERLIRLPDGFLCYRPPDAAPPTAPPPCTANGFITFGSFNNPAKITPEVVELWSRILLAVPDSRLLLKSKPFCDPELARAFSAAFASHGLAPERIICVAATETISDHLATYARIDIALDPFPYNGTTTTFEALHMGVPVVVLRGNRHAARVGAAILTGLGLSQLIAASADEYHGLAVSLSRDIPRLVACHAGLRDRLASSPLADAARFADSLEDAYRTAWRRYSHGHPPSPPAMDERFLQARNLFLEGEYGRARSLYGEILAAHPDTPRALHGMGVASHHLGDSASATECISRALELHPAYTLAWVSLAAVYRETGRVGEAFECHRRTLALDPGFSEIHSAVLMNMQYLPQYGRDQIHAEARRWSACHGRRPLGGGHDRKELPDTGRLRIGFVSADFRRHPVGFIIIPFLAGYDRERFEVVCYSNGAESDEVTQQIASLVDRWRVIDGMSDRDAWQVIRDDAVDVLVDLSGHTAGNRLLLFSMRPAPVQISWLGYFDTTGLDAMDFLITDRFVAPPGEERWFSEKLVHLPDSRFCYAPPAYAPLPGTAPVLANGYVTFGSYNNIAKLTDEVIAAWADILRQVCGSRLIVKWKNCRDAALIRRYQELFRSQGIEPEGRVEFRGESGHQELLGQYREIDIALDPFPFSGGLTSLEALWMGVPIITLNGDRPVSRQSAGFLKLLGHGELVADTVVQYCACAVALANDAERLALLHRNLREEMRLSPLCNVAAFAGNMCDLFERIAPRRPCLSAMVAAPSREDELAGRCNRAAHLVAEGKLDEAEACYEALLADDGGYPRALHALGVIRYRKGERDRGIELVRSALSRQPDYVDALSNLGRMLHEEGLFPEAAHCYCRVAELRPDDRNAPFLMALILSKAGRRDEAVSAYRRVIADDPDHVDAMFNLGQLLTEAGCSDEAGNLLRRASVLAPDNAGVLIALGNLALNQRKLTDAEAYYAAACAVDPESAEAHTNRGHLCTELKRTVEAIEHCRRAVELKPDFAQGWVNLGCALEKSGQILPAVDAYRKALELDPGFRAAHSSLIMLMNYLPSTTPADLFQESRRWDAYHGARLRDLWSSAAEADMPGRPLRIGFISPDFHRHPVGYFVQAFFLLHDRERFRIVCYSDVAVEDDVTETLREAADCWRSVRTLDDRQLNQLIRDDRIDILVDLAGHTAGNRLRLFAMKPAPVQATWAGYVGTTGLSAMDYLISDRYQSPPGAEQYGSERIIRMPHGYVSYCTPAYAPDVTELPALSNGYITFCVFNNLAKVSADAIALWAEVLRQVQGARLLFKNPSLDDQETVERYLLLFESHGISRARIVTEGQSPPAEMLGRYARADIQLDTFPYSGGLTTLESLWMGVPVVTLPGELFSSRHSLSHLTNAGLAGCIASSREEYVAIARRLAGNLENLAELRASLRHRMAVSPLCDGALFTGNLQCAFTWMWRHRHEPSADLSLVFETGQGECTSLATNQSDVLRRGDTFSRALSCLVQKDFLEAAELFEQILSSEPDNADAHNNLGIAYYEIGFRDDAKDEFRLATEISPTHAEAWRNLGKAVRDTGGNPEEAARCFRKALSLEPCGDDTWMMLGTTLLDRGRSVEAVTCFNRALELNPANRDAHSNLLFAMNYLPNISQGEMLRESRRWGERHAAGILPMRRDGGGGERENGKLRIGFVSGDFRRHPVGYHLLPVLMQYDRERFQVFCYATRAEQDDLTEEMRGCADAWRDIGRLADDAAAELICDDRIDILVDLSGHTQGNRLLLFARRPAQVQVSWLGYFNTTGLDAVDYLISDETTIPQGEEPLFTERVVRLPGSRFCYAPPAYAPQVSPPPVLSNGFITFGSFNNIAKLTPEVVELWCLVLHALPDSRLIVKWSTLGRKKERDRLLRRFQRHGVSADRLVLRGRSPHEEMLQEYGDIDIALDPFPFSGGMTSCEALWMGVPVLTLRGDKPAGRQTAGFLRTIGLGEWVADSWEQYLSRITAAAADRHRLEALRFSLRDLMTASTLCDGAAFTRNLESLFLSMAGERNARQKSAAAPGSDGRTSGTGAAPPSGQIAAAMSFNEGVDRMEAGNVQEAIELFERAVAIDPGFTAAHNNLGILMAWTGRDDGAERAFTEALAADPSFCEAHYNLGLVCATSRRFRQAIDHFNDAISLNPGYGEAYLEKGNVLHSLGESQQALECYEAAASLLPESAVASNNIGTIYLRMEEAHEAERYFREALLYDSGYAPAYVNLSTLCCESGRVSEAERVASAGLDHVPDDPRLLSTRARALAGQCRIPEAVRVLHRAVELDPEDAAVHSNLLYALQYSDDCSLETLLSEHAAWSGRHVDPDAVARQFPNAPEPERRLVIGYVSPDFGRHPVGYFLMPVLPAHDREQVRVICYSDRKRIDDQTLALEANADLWRDTSNCSDQELADLIAHDGVDILVDLAGHTAGNRLTLFARRVAPIQVTWAGYVGTTGLSTMDCLISDDNESPQYADGVTVERIVRLPDGYVCYGPPEYAPEVGPLPALSNGCVTFGCFNNLAKINGSVIELWAELLRKLPGSRILLKTKSLNDQETRDRYHRMFSDYAVGPERVMLEGDARHVDLLAAYNRVDIALDPFPYSGGLTTLETLWMGVPVVTLGGERFCSRHSLSHLTNLGLRETIAADEGAYLAVALSLAGDLEGVALLRATLRERMRRSPLCDGATFTRNLEAGFRAMWQTWCKGNR